MFAWTIPRTILLVLVLHFKESSSIRINLFLPLWTGTLTQVIFSNQSSIILKMASFTSCSKTSGNILFSYWLLQLYKSTLIFYLSSPLEAKTSPCSNQLIVWLLLSIIILLKRFLVSKFNLEKLPLAIPIRYTLYWTFFLIWEASSLHYLLLASSLSQDLSINCSILILWIQSTRQIPK